MAALTGTLDDGYVEARGSGLVGGEVKKAGLREGLAVRRASCALAVRTRPCKAKNRK